MTTLPTCSIDGCDSPVRARGWCITHYSRWRKTGDPGPAARLRMGGHVGCQADDCPAPHYSRGWCAVHYERVRVHGDPTTVLVSVPPVMRGVDHPRWGGDEVGYVAVHGRLRRSRGDASGYLCLCGDQAAEWAYDHLDPNARQDPKEGPYSTNPDHYVAMCRPCHRRADMNRAGQTY